jgi:hypothetical protein
MTFVDVTAEFPAMPFVDPIVESPLLTADVKVEFPILAETDIPILSEIDISLFIDRACPDGFDVPGDISDEFAVLIVTDTHIFFATDIGSEMSATGIQYSNLGV